LIATTLWTKCTTRLPQRIKPLSDGLAGFVGDVDVIKGNDVKFGKA